MAKFEVGDIVRKVGYLSPSYKVCGVADGFLWLRPVDGAPTDGGNITSRESDYELVPQTVTITLDKSVAERLFVELGYCQAYVNFGYKYPFAKTYGIASGEDMNALYEAFSDAFPYQPQDKNIKNIKTV